MPHRALWQQSIRHARNRRVQLATLSNPSYKRVWVDCHDSGVIPLEQASDSPRLCYNPRYVLICDVIASTLPQNLPQELSFGFRQDYPSY